MSDEIKRNDDQIVIKGDEAQRFAPIMFNPLSDDNNSEMARCHTGLFQPSRG